MAGRANAYSYVPSPTAWIDPLGLNRKGADCERAAKKFAEKKHEIELQIAQHDYNDSGHVGAKLTIPGSVSGAIANERATGLKTGGRSHTMKGLGIRNRLKKILKKSDAANSLTPCQKAHLHNLADPYIARINAAFATPLAQTQETKS